MLGYSWLTAFPDGAGGKEPASQHRRRERRGFNLWIDKTSWRMEWQPIPVFLGGESHGWRSLAGYSPWGHRWLNTRHTQLQFYHLHIWIIFTSTFVHLYVYITQIFIMSNHHIFIPSVYLFVTFISSYICTIHLSVISISSLSVQFISLLYLYLYHPYIYTMYISIYHFYMIIYLYHLYI